MPLNNTQLRYYDSNVLRLPSDKRKEYHAQVDRLVAELCKSIRDQAEITITDSYVSINPLGTDSKNCQIPTKVPSNFPVVSGKAWTSPNYYSRI
jgi:hypothetical protein